ncbi:hypothetical protein HJC23_005509 [Cyclotella cryptica]|uniref:Reverse transcriptase domain-containing protein n=1 Tax=Cyclotella cryptica TaxID=29204 RepID=A0ABD3PFX8_9STRA
MPDFECAHVFHQNVAALKHLDIGPALYLNTLGNQLNAATSVDGGKFDWKRHFEKNWNNFMILTILSYHNSAGVLKPITDGLANAARRPEDTTVALTNAAGTDILVTTSVGEANLAALTPDQATIETKELKQLIETKIYNLAITTIEKQIFAAICPNYSSKPHTILENIKQWSKNAEGHVEVQSFREYCLRFQAAMRPFSQMDEMPVDLCSLMIQGMHSDLKSQFEELYPNHAIQHGRNGHQHRKTLAEIQRLGTIAEGKIKTVQRIVGNTTGQTFAYSPALVSQAERTLTQYNSNEAGKHNESRGGRGGRGNRGDKGGRGGDYNNPCDGCGQRGHWLSFKGTITCPNKDKQGVFENAMKKKAARAKESLSTRKNCLAKREPDLDNLTEAGRKMMKQQVLAATNGEGEDERSESSLSVPRSPPKRSRSTSPKPPIILVAQIFKAKVCASQGTQPMLPIMSLVDTAASLNMGNFFFWSKLAQAFPHCIKAVYTAENVAPITLTGIVKADTEGTKTTTQLPVAFELHLPYKTLDGAPPSVIFGCGPDVSVNAILGLPFIKATKMDICVSDATAECKALDCAPFSIKQKRARVDINSFTQSAAAIPGVNKTKRAQFMIDDNPIGSRSSTDIELRSLLPPNDVSKSYCKPAMEAGGDEEEPDELFSVQFDPHKHSSKLKSELNLDHLEPVVQSKLVGLVKKYWPVFADECRFFPLRDYECVIDTGNARPICVKNINYGPRETPIMLKCISALKKINQISQTQKGQWLFKALLAPKPHQEHDTHIEDFVWVIAFPIPRCDSAVFICFGDGSWFWLADAIHGYNQVRVEKSSREKLAFAGLNTTKWQWNVMPFGPVNGPAIFIAAMHDLDSTWKQLAENEGIVIDDDTNTRIIVDDLWSWAKTLPIALAYLKCQLRTMLAQRLSLSLKKCHFFPKRIEFVGIDVSRDDNRPAMSKHKLLKTWPKPTIIRDIASFVGFAVFYAVFIPFFELRATRLREIMKGECEKRLTTELDKVAEDEWTGIQNAILADPCLKRFDHRKRVYIISDFCAKGFAYVATQPGDDEPSIAAMMREMAGGDCEFLREGNEAKLHPHSDIIFNDTFGVEFTHEGSIFVRPIAPFELARCFSLSNDLTHKLSQPDYVHKLANGFPGHTSAWVFDQILDRLIEIRNANCEVFDPSRHAAPTAAIQAFVNGAIGARLPSNDRWAEAYANDKQMALIMTMIKNPSLINKHSLTDIDVNYRGPLRQSRLILENNMIILKETLVMNTSSYDLAMVLLARDVRLLQENVLIMPRLYKGHKVHLIAACGMTSFACAEPIKKVNSATFAKALMKIMLSYGISHTIVLDKDSKFYSTFRAMVDFLLLNVHTLSADNHKTMLVERINRFLNKGLRIFTNERGLIRTADEAILLLLYAWNSAPIAGTDLSRSLVAVGREFRFPIDISATKHLELVSTPAAVKSYAKDQATLLTASREIAKALLEEQRAMHRELVNSRRPDPREGLVGKLQYSHTGPWRITQRLDGGSYELEHILQHNTRVKKHASHLSPFPLPLVPFEPVDGPDNRFAQLNRPISREAYSEAGIKGFKPLNLFKSLADVNFGTVQNDFDWLTLSELNDKIWPPEWQHICLEVEEDDDRIIAPAMEWRLIRVNLEGSMSLRPSCLTDDLRFNATNQRLWLQYHKEIDLRSPSIQAETHLIQPSDTWEQLAKRHNLVPMQQWYHSRMKALIAMGLSTLPQSMDEKAAIA